MLYRSLAQMAVAVAIWAAAVQSANAQAAFFGTESIGYTGTWTQYSNASLTTAVGSGTVFQTDLNVYASNNSSLAGAPPGSNGLQFQTITYVTNAGTNGPTSGNYVGNIVGVYPASGWTQTLYNPITNQFTTSASGFTSGGSGSLFDPVLGPGNSNPLYGTLVNALGEWTSFNFSIVASPTGAVSEGPIGTFTSDQLGTTTGASGTFHGVFANSNGTDFFVVDLNINNINAARAGAGNTTSGGAAANGFFGPLDGFQGVVPEPASCLTFAMVFGASVTYGWRRRQRRLAV